MTADLQYLRGIIVPRITSHSSSNVGIWLAIGDVGTFWRLSTEILLGYCSLVCIGLHCSSSSSHMSTLIVEGRRCSESGWWRNWISLGKTPSLAFSRNQINLAVKGRSNKSPEMCQRERESACFDTASRRRPPPSRRAYCV